jgi:hypothetical protein
MLLIGLGAAVFPEVRVRYLERRYRLAKPSTDSGTLKEIETFLSMNGSSLGLRLNLLRSSPLAFVYAGRRRQANLALFGSFLRLWKADRRAAESVLLHEMAHRRRGDERIIGVGSPFEAILKYSVLGTLFLVFLPFAIGYVDQAIRAVAELRALGTSREAIGEHWLHQIFATILPGLFLIFIGFLAQLAAVLVAPLAGIWSAELNADYLASTNSGGGQGVGRGLLALEGPNRGLRWLLLHLSHPPVALRRWLLKKEGGATHTLWLLLLFPFAYIAQLLFMLGVPLSNQLLMALVRAPTPANPSLSKAVHDAVRAWITTRSYVWIAMAALLLAWPFLSGAWMRLLSGERREVAVTPYLPYVLCALSAGTLGVIGLAFR